MRTARLALVATASILLAACGGGGDDAPEAEQPLSAAAWAGSWAGTLRYEGTVTSIAGFPCVQGADAPTTLRFVGQPPQFEWTVTSTAPMAAVDARVLNDVSGLRLQLGYAYNVRGSIEWDLQLLSTTEMKVAYRVSDPIGNGNGYCQSSWSATLQRTAGS